jgi:hypothetical protein
MYQTHSGFTAVLNGLSTIQASLGVLQATTAMIGVGTATGVALSAVNLHQTLKLREDVKHLRLEVKNGFIDLKQALKDQGADIIQRIEQVAQDIEFRHHRMILVRAYGLFTQAINRLRLAMQLQDMNRRNFEIDAARGMLFEALADYANPQLLEETCSAGQLRRLECTWAIEQAVITTYQVQNELGAVSDRLIYLQNKICQDVLNVIDFWESEDELDFLFPEITRIHNHDLAVLESWQNHVDWVRSLPAEDLKLLNSSDFSSSEASINSNLNGETITPGKLLEQLLYENLKQRSHPVSLDLQLQFMIKPDLRHKYELYTSEQADLAGHKALNSSSLQQASNLTVANLYWYFKIRDESEDEEEAIA